MALRGRTLPLAPASLAGALASSVANTASVAVALADAAPGIVARAVAVRVHVAGAVTLAGAGLGASVSLAPELRGKDGSGRGERKRDGKCCAYDEVLLHLRVLSLGGGLSPVAYNTSEATKSVHTTGKFLERFSAAPCRREEPCAERCLRLTLDKHTINLCNQLV